MKFRALFLILALVLCLPLAAQVTLHPPSAVPAAPDPAPDYGTSTASTVSMWAWDFDPVDSATPYTDDGNAARFFNTAGGRKVWIGSVHIPSGVTITQAALDYCDSSAAGNFSATLYDFTATGAANFITNINTPDQACGLATSAALSYNLDANTGHYIGFIVFQPEVLNGSVKLIGANISYKRRVSPGPATATFADVSNASGIYRFVEALAAAGITGGCGGGNYCPNDPVTRGQMAVFLSVALGLHFPN